MDKWSLTEREAAAGQRYCHAIAIPTGIADALPLVSTPGSGAQPTGERDARRPHDVLELKVKLSLTHIQILGTVVRCTQIGKLPFQFRNPGTQCHHLIRTGERHRYSKGSALPGSERAEEGGR